MKDEGWAENPSPPCGSQVLSLEPESRMKLFIWHSDECLGNNLSRPTAHPTLLPASQPVLNAA